MVKVLLLTTFCTLVEYWHLPFQIVNLPWLFLNKPLDPAQKRLPPWEKPRGYVHKHIIEVTLEKRRLEAGELQIWKQVHGSLSWRLTIKLWVFHDHMGLVSVSS